MLSHIGTRQMETERLILRKFKIQDSEQMFNNWAKDPQNVKYLSWKAHENINETKNLLASWIKMYENKNYYRWCIELKSTKEVIGGIDVTSIEENTDCCEIGYVLSKKYWNKNIMTEALKEIEKYLFEKVGANRIQAWYMEDNEASGKVMKKCRMKYEGVLREFARKNTGELCGAVFYSILKSEFICLNKI